MVNLIPVLKDRAKLMTTLRVENSRQDACAPSGTALQR